MDILCDFYNNSVKTMYNTLPSIKDALRDIGIREPNVDFKEIINDIIKKIPDSCYDTFISSLSYVNKFEIKSHQEPYGYHALYSGIVAAYICAKYGGNPKIGFRLGFLHDIGKPFCESERNTTHSHGQVGVHLANLLFDDIDDETKIVFLLLIDQHMCHCNHYLETHKLSYQVLSSMMTDFTVYQRNIFNIYYRALVISNRVGKIVDMNMTIHDANIIATYSLSEINKCTTIPKLSGSIILIMHGASGCGKTAAAGKFNKILTSKYGLSVGIIEHNWLLWEIAKRKKFIDDTITFDKFMNESVLIDGHEITYYKHYYHLIRKFVNDYYKIILDEFREKYNVIIIDSTISIDYNTLCWLIPQSDTVFMWIGFPQHMLENNSKNNNHINYPLTHNNAFYRSIVEGASNSIIFRPLLCSSLINELSAVIGKLNVI